MSKENKIGEKRRGKKTEQEKREDRSKKFMIRDEDDAAVS